MKIVIGCDHGGFKLKERLKVYLKKAGHKVRDLGTYSQESCDYPKISEKVAKKVAKRKSLRGILICRTGIGSSIVANKIPGIRASLCYNKEVAKLSREHNDANLLVLGADFLDFKEAKEILKIWLKTPFIGGRHRRRVLQIKRLEKKLFGLK